MVKVLIEMENLSIIKPELLFGEVQERIRNMLSFNYCIREPRLIPTDFIGFSESLHGNSDHHNKLMANFIAQTEALLQGTDGVSVENNFKKFEGNKPTNTLIN